jgi:SAM-dependent methyltransferase
MAVATRLPTRPQFAGALKIAGCLLEETTFVDVGCGKGRALIVAAMYPFQRIMGIEYAPDLAKACRKNLKTLHLTERCEVVESDAAEFKFPNGKLFAYICNPFGRVVFDRVLRNLASTQGQVRFGGRVPIADDEILRTGIVRAIGSWEGLRLCEISRT